MDLRVLVRVYESFKHAPFITGAKSTMVQISTYVIERLMTPCIKGRLEYKAAVVLPSSKTAKYIWLQPFELRRSAVEEEDDDEKDADAADEDGEDEEADDSDGDGDGDGAQQTKKTIIDMIRDIDTKTDSVPPPFLSKMRTVSQNTSHSIVPTQTKETKAGKILSKMKRANKSSARRNLLADAAK